MLGECPSSVVRCQSSVVRCRVALREAKSREVRREEVPWPKHVATLLQRTTDNGRLTMDNGQLTAVLSTAAQRLFVAAHCGGTSENTDPHIAPRRSASKGVERAARGTPGNSAGHRRGGRGRPGPLHTVVPGLLQFLSNSIAILAEPLGMDRKCPAPISIYRSRLALPPGRAAALPFHT